MKCILLAVILSLPAFAQYEANKTIPTLVDTARKAVTAAEFIGNTWNHTNQLIPLFIDELKAVRNEIKALKEQIQTPRLLETATAVTTAVLGIVTAFLLGHHLAKKHAPCCIPVEPPAPSNVHLNFVSASSESL